MSLQQGPLYCEVQYGIMFRNRVSNRERKCADTVGTELVPRAAWPFPMLKYKYFSNKIYRSNFIEQHMETVMV